MASGGTSPGESAAATAMAEKLMKKHGIRDSEINKNRYTQGERAGRKTEYRPPRQSSRSHDSTWDDYAKWTKQQRRTREREYNDFRNSYYQQTFDPKFVRADKLRETDKAYLLNVYLDESKYPWSTLPVVTVSTWIPKSQVTMTVGNTWLLNRELLIKNLQANIPRLLKNHPVFRSQTSIAFYFKDPI